MFFSFSETFEECTQTWKIETCRGSGVRSGRQKEDWIGQNGEDDHLFVVV